MVRSLASVQDVELGFDAPRLVVAEVTLPANDHPTAQERLAWVDRAVAALGATPGVTSASAVAWLPLNHETMSAQVAPPELAGTPRAEWPLAVLNSAHPGYFETMGIPLLEGRTFARADDADGEPVVLVSRSLARRFWPGGSAVGRTLLAGDDQTPPERYRVVGVVGDVRHSDLSGNGAPLQLYRPTLQGAGRRYFVLARTEGAPADLVVPMREALLAADPNQPATVRPLSAVVRENLLQWSIGSAFLGAFGAGALLLASLGIYGLIAYSVAQRRREIGVRLALGATRAQIRRVVVGEGVRMAAVGLGVGLLLALALGRAIAAALYGVGPFDPVTLGAVVAVFLGVAALASLVPAERASRTDPIHVLRAE
jgi:putative ABC transport system permease protein